MKILHFAFPFSMFVRGGIPMSHASKTHLQYIISSFSSFAIHFLVNSGVKSKFDLQTKKHMQKLLFYLLKAWKNYTATQRYLTNGSLSYVYIFSFVALLKNVVLCGHSAGSLRALPDTENKSPAPPARPWFFTSWTNMLLFKLKFVKVNIDFDVLACTLGSDQYLIFHTGISGAMTKTDNIKFNFLCQEP